MPYNICFLLSDFPDPTFGGVENITAQLADAFSSAGHNISFLVFNKSQSPVEYAYDWTSLNWDNYKEVAIEFVKRKSIDIIINQSHHYIFEVLCEYLRKKVDVKLIRCLHTDPEAHIKGIADCEPLLTESTSIKRYIFKISPVTLFKKHNRYTYLRKRYSSWIKIYHAVIVISREAVDRLIRYAHSQLTSSHCQIKYIPNFSGLKPDPISKLQKEKIILWVGRMEREAKRPDRMIVIWKQIWRENRDWKLVMIGTGSLKQKLEEYVEKNRIGNIFFTGRINPDDYYKESSILCLTSTYEGHPLVIEEAVNYDNKIIAFDSFCGASELKERYNILLVKPFSINKYCKTLVDEMHLYNKHLEKEGYQSMTNVELTPKEEILNKWYKLFDQLYRNKY